MLDCLYFRGLLDDSLNRYFEFVSVTGLFRAKMLLPIMAIFEGDELVGGFVHIEMKVVHFKHAIVDPLVAERLFVSYIFVGEGSHLANPRCKKQNNENNRS